MISKAAVFAEKAHRGSVRKGTTIPYITHPLETAVIVSLLTDDVDLISAALLHDTIEDAGVSYEEIEMLFGSRVADLVQEETEDKSKTWLERKTRTVEHLKTASYEVKLLTLADKLSNIRSTARDYLLVGEEVWQRFNVKERRMHAWYYTSMIESLAVFKETPQYQEYVALCRQVFG